MGNGSHRRTETGQRGDVVGQTLELPIVAVVRMKAAASRGWVGH